MVWYRLLSITAWNFLLQDFTKWQHSSCVTLFHSYCKRSKSLGNRCDFFAYILFPKILCKFSMWIKFDLYARQYIIVTFFYKGMTSWMLQCDTKHCLAWKWALLLESLQYLVPYISSEVFCTLARLAFFISQTRRPVQISEVIPKTIMLLRPCLNLSLTQFLNNLGHFIDKQIFFPLIQEIGLLFVIEMHFCRAIISSGHAL